MSHMPDDVTKHGPTKPGGNTCPRCGREGTCNCVLIGIMDEESPPPEPQRVATDEEVAEWRKFGEASLDVFGHKPLRESYRLLRAFTDSIFNRLTAERNAKEGWELEAVKQRERAERAEARDKHKAEYLRAILDDGACWDCSGEVRDMECPSCTELVGVLTSLLDLKEEPEAPDDPT